MTYLGAPAGSISNCELAIIKSAAQNALAGKAASTANGAPRKWRIIQIVCVKHTPMCIFSNAEKPARPLVSLLIIVSHKKLALMEGFWRSLELRIEHEFQEEAEVLILVHTRTEVQRYLKLGRGLIADIVGKGITVTSEDPLQDINNRISPTLEVAVGQNSQLVSEVEARVQSHRLFAEMYLAAAKSRSTETNREALCFAAFQLHQAAENLFRMILITTGQYSPSTHNISKLRSLASRFFSAVLDVWRRDEEAEEQFSYLARAYIEARYSREYSPSGKMISQQIKCLEELSLLAVVVCEQKLAEFALQVSPEA